VACFLEYTYMFDPTSFRILVDDMAIRQYKNHWDAGVPFPVNQPMRLYGVLWDADDWATEGGRIKTDWSQAPFVAYFQNYRAQGCAPSAFSWVCGLDPFGGDWFGGGAGMDNLEQQRQLREARDKYMIYNYCTDTVRFPDGYPKECGLA
jgi:xyloglucan:xyloglucosyl transferase